MAATLSAAPQPVPGPGTGAGAPRTVTQASSLQKNPGGDVENP
jgi:hypothetical protein